MRIPLTKGQFAIVDAEDYEELSRFKWHSAWSPFTKSFYAMRSVYPKNGRSITEQMHRRILSLEYGDKRQGDHINHNTLDNRRNNLRVATKSENNRNSRKSLRNTSGFKGVSWHTRDKTWQANIRINRKLLHLGYFSTPQLAADAYDDAARKMFGEFAKTNS
jgi:hypothetical protein